MSADFDIVGFALAHCLHHYEGVSGVEATGYVGDVYKGVELGVGPAFEVAIAFAQVDVQEGLVLYGSHLELL